MPPNLQTVSLKFSRRRSAKVMGSLAARQEPAEGEEVQGVLVTHNFTSKIVKPEDLAATIFQLLGIDPGTAIYDRDHRPLIIGGNTIHDVIA